MLEDEIFFRLELGKNGAVSVDFRYLTCCDKILYCGSMMEPPSNLECHFRTVELPRDCHMTFLQLFVLQFRGCHKIQCRLSFPTVVDFLTCCSSSLSSLSSMSRWSSTGLMGQWLHSIRSSELLSSNGFISDRNCATDSSVWTQEHYKIMIHISVQK